MDQTQGPAPKSLPAPSDPLAHAEFDRVNRVLTVYPLNDEHTNSRLNCTTP